MNDSQVFYNREDQWSIPSEFYGGEESKMESIYSTYRIPGEKQAEFLLSIRREIGRASCRERV